MRLRCYGSEIDLSLAIVSGQVVKIPEYAVSLTLRLWNAVIVDVIKDFTIWQVYVECP